MELLNGDIGGETFDAEAIKDQLLKRGRIAKDKLGPKWRSEVKKVDLFFNSYEGFTYLNAFQTALGKSGTKRVSIERIHRVTKALEAAAGIPYKPIMI